VLGATTQQFTLQGSSASVITGKNGSFTTTLGFTTPTANNSINLPNESGTICLQTSASCGFATGSGAAFVQNGNSFGAAATLGTNDSNSLNLETNNATQATIATGGATTFRNSSNSTSAFSVQNANAGNLLNIDTSTTANLLTNGDFEQSGTTGWTARGATLSRSTSNQVQGNASLSIAVTADNDGAQYNYALAATTTYTLSFYAKVSSGSISSFAFGHSNDSGASDSSCLTGQTLNTTWKRFTCTFTMGGSVSGTRYLYYIDTAGSGTHTLLLDAVQLEAGSTATAFTAGGAVQFGGVINSPLAIKPLQDSSQVLQVQNAAGNPLLTVDTTANTVVLGKANVQSGVLVFSDGSSNNAVNLQTATLGANYTLNLPNVAAGTYDICITAGNCSGTADSLQTVYNTSIGGSTPEIKLDATRGAVDILRAVWAGPGRADLPDGLRNESLSRRPVRD